MSQDFILGSLVKSRALSEASSIAAWSKIKGIPYYITDSVVNGRRRYISHQTVQLFAKALGLSEKEVRLLIPGTMEEKHSKQGLTVGKWPWTDERRRSHSEALRSSEEHRSKSAAILKEIWSDRKAMLAMIRARENNLDRGSADARALASFKRYCPHHKDKVITTQLLDLWAAKLTSKETRRGHLQRLPSLYLRAKFYQFAGFKWPGLHPPNTLRFERVCSWKAEGRSWREIRQLLLNAGDEISLDSLKKWWRHFCGWQPTREPKQRTKLTAAQVNAIRARYRQGNISMSKLEEEFRLARGYVWMIVHHKVWASLPEEVIQT